MTIQVIFFKFLFFIFTLINTFLIIYFILAALRVKSLKLNNDKKMLFSVVFRRKIENCREEEFLRNIQHEQMIEDFPDVLIDYYESKMNLK